MNCYTVRNKLNDYLEHSISHDMAEAIEEHLAQCESCRSLYEEEQRIDDAFKEALSITDVKFRSTRADIMKGIDPDRYKKNNAKSIKYHVQKYSKGYMATAAVLALGICITSVAMHMMTRKENSVAMKQPTTAERKVPMAKFTGNEANPMMATEAAGTSIYSNTPVDDRLNVVIKKGTPDTNIVMQLVEQESGNVLQEVNLAEDFKVQAVDFGTEEFQLSLIDYNHDGNLEFALGQREGTGYRYLFYSIQRMGGNYEFKKIGFEVGGKDIADIFKAFDSKNAKPTEIIASVERNPYSPRFEEGPMHTLIIPKVGVQSAGNVEEFYAWNKATNMFDLISSTDTVTPNVYPPKLIKSTLDSNAKADFATEWKPSSDGRFEACLQGRGAKGTEEGLSKLFVKDTRSNEQWSIEVDPNTGQDTVKSFEWLDETNLLVTIGLGYGTVSTGGSVYVIDVQSGRIITAYKAKDHEEVTDIKKDGNKLELKVKTFTDDNYNTFKTRTETYNLSE